MHRSLIAVALLLLTPLAHAQVYKWTDPNGTVHYSETPPAEGTKFNKVKTSGGVDPIAAPTPAAAASAAPAPTPATVADTPENRHTLCESLKSNLAVLQGSGPVVMQQGGKSTALDDAQRKARTATDQGQYQQYCQSQ